MDSAAARWKRPWEEAVPPHRRYRCSPPAASDRALLHQHPEPARPWAFGALYTPPEPQSQADDSKRRRLFSPQPDPHLQPRPADSAAFHGSGEAHDGERGRQPPPPASPAMSSAHLDARGFLPPDDGACCEASCGGLACTRRRALIRDIVAEVDVLNAGIRRVILQSNSQPPSHSSGLASLGTDHALAFAADLLRANVASLRDLTNPLPSPSAPGADHHSASTTAAAAAAAEIRDVMKRRFDSITHPDPPLYLPLPTSGGDRDPSRTIPPLAPYDDAHRSFQGSRDPLSPHHSPPGAHPVLNTGHVYHTRPPSPIALPSHQNPPPHRMLPSPSSLNIPAPSTILSLASPSPSLLPQPSLSSASTNTTAHSTHLQDLQHQISLKTLALQTLRQEYAALLAKLDRQRTKCAALERKFEVTDVEINTLTADKEELEARAAALERQVDELRAQRDTARRREVRTGEQYRSIVEMAGRLQGAAAEEKRAWAREREGLLRALGRGEEGGPAAGDGGQEHGMVDVDGRGSGHTGSGADDSTSRRPFLDATGLSPPNQDLDQLGELAAPAPATDAAASQVIAALRVEVAHLRSRTQVLETAISSICNEGTRMEEASQTMAEAGRKMKEAALEAVKDK